MTGLTMTVVCLSEDEEQDNYYESIVNINIL